MYFALSLEPIVLSHVVIYVFGGLTLSARALVAFNFRNSDVLFSCAV